MDECGIGEMAVKVVEVAIVLSMKVKSICIINSISVILFSMNF